MPGVADEHAPLPLRDDPSRPIVDMIERSLHESQQQATNQRNGAQGSLGMIQLIFN